MLFLLPAPSHLVHQTYHPLLNRYFTLLEIHVLEVSMVLDFSSDDLISQYAELKATT